MTDTATDDRTMTKEETAGIALLKRYAKNPDGEEILRRFADSIQVANRFERKQWVPTARKMKGWTVNLRTGQIYALTLKRDEVQILLLPQMLGAEERKALEEAQHHKYEPKHPPGSARYTLDLPKARKLWGLIENAHHAVLRHRRHTSGAKAPEADALIDALRDELKLELPYPDRGVVDSGGEDDAPSNQGPSLLEAYAARAEGRVILRALADSIMAANAEGHARWGTTVAKDYVALNVGRVCGVRLHDDRVRILLMPDTLEPDVRKALEEAMLHSWDRAAIPGARNYELHWPTAANMWERLHDAHHEALASARQGRTMHNKSHSDAVIDSLNSILRLELPYPDYGGVKPPPPSNGGRFSDLLRKLNQEGLLFSVETVANYVLALQTKRFAILTGISGTGKTRIAMTVARSFRARVRDRQAADPDTAAVAEDAFKMTARPFHFNHKQLILPVAFVAEIDRFLTPEGNSNGGPIKVSFPGGRSQLRFWKDPKPDRSGTWLLFAGAHDFRDWYFANLQPDQHFYISPREGNQAGDHWLEFSLPETEETERDLDTYTVVPVRPDWVDNRGLLGYLNPITGAYSTTPFLSLLLEAQEEEKRAGKEGRHPHPFFVVLDEMNLARVEHYFSDFLSALESGEPIPLHDSEEVEEGETESESGPAVPRQLRVPDNVFFTGTVNVDETTYMFSPKVLDRAFTIEFDQVDLKGYTDGKVPPESGGLDLGTGAALALIPYRNPKPSDWRDFCRLDGGRYGKVLRKLHGVLEEEHRHFGYRVANEIARFVNLAHAQSSGDEAAVRTAFDLALRQKVLPKFHGTQQELEPLLKRLFNFAVDGRDGRRGDSEISLSDWRPSRGGRLSWAGKQMPTSGDSVPAGTAEAGDEPADGADGETEDSTPTIDADSVGTEADASEGTTASAGVGPKSRDPEFPRTAAKLWRMLKRLEQRGFTSFIE